MPPRLDPPLEGADVIKKPAGSRVEQALQAVGDSILLLCRGELAANSKPRQAIMERGALVQLRASTTERGSTQVPDPPSQLPPPLQHHHYHQLLPNPPHAPSPSLAPPPDTITIATSATSTTTTTANTAIPISHTPPLAKWHIGQAEPVMW